MIGCWILSHAFLYKWYNHRNFLLSLLIRKMTLIGFEDQAYLEQSPLGHGVHMYILINIHNILNIYINTLLDFICTFVVVDFCTKVHVRYRFVLYSLCLFVVSRKYWSQKMSWGSVSSSSV